MSFILVEDVHLMPLIKLSIILKNLHCQCLTFHYLLDINHVDKTYIVLKTQYLVIINLLLCTISKSNL